MHVWLMLLIPSAITGALCAFVIKGKWGAHLAAFLPFFGLFCALIYSVYLAPGADGGDGFWIIALVVGGSVAAFVSVQCYLFTQKAIQKQSKDQS